MPPSVVIPELGYSDIGAAMEWLQGAFGFTLRLRIADHRAQMKVGDGDVVLTVSETSGASAVMVRVEDVPAHCERARRFGARIVREPADYPYGERQYTAEDLGGHRWTFSETIADVDPRDWGGVLGEPHG